jgi:hypothetical protein
MVATLLALLAMQVQPNATVARPLLLSPGVATAVRLNPKEQKLAEARALVIRAESFNAGYEAKPGQPTKAELDAAIDKVKSDLDSMSEMGEMESLRLQMAMDRMSKMMSTLSNLLKKASDTQQAIIQNIK